MTVDDHTEVDLCVDHRLLPAEPSALGPVLALEELAANKLLALFDRVEARDFVDEPSSAAQACRCTRFLSGLGVTDEVRGPFRQAPRRGDH